MQIGQLLQGVEIREANVPLDTEIQGISYDSRSTQPGQVFVAIPGYQCDGNRFIPMALEKGAAAIVCQSVPEQPTPYILVPSSRAALARMAANWFDHPAKKLCMIGVTGTNGKTTVTTMLKMVLERTRGAQVGLIGTIENRIGQTALPTERTTPESYELQQLLHQMVLAGCSHCVMEVSSHALALERTAGIEYEVGVFTNLTEDHLDFHRDMDDYAQAKAKLFRQCRHGVFNLDDPYCQTMMEHATCTKFTTAIHAGKANLLARNIVLRADHISAELETDSSKTSLYVGIPGGFTVYNCLSVVAAALCLGIRPEESAAALRHAHGVPGRMEVVPTPGKPYTVLIDYAHTPDALENVLKSVKGFCRGRVIAVFGCGGDRDPLKRPIMGKIGIELADLAIITSDNPRTEDPDKIIEDILQGVGQSGDGSAIGPVDRTSYTDHEPITEPSPDWPRYLVEENRKKAIFLAMELARPEDIIVLCGKGHETYQIRGTKKLHFDEREIVREGLLWRR